MEMHGARYLGNKNERAIVESDPMANTPHPEADGKARSVQSNFETPIPVSNVTEDRSESHSKPTYTEKDTPKGKEFQCGLCSKTFIHRGMMNRHMKHHGQGLMMTGSTANKCPTCGRTFAYRSSFERHRNRVHSVKLGYSCKICKRKFRYKSTLDHHLMAVHKDLRPHKCDKCGKACRTKYKLAEHMLVHREAKAPASANTDDLGEEGAAAAFFALAVPVTNLLRIRCPRMCGREFPSVEMCIRHQAAFPDCAADRNDTSHAATDCNPDIQTHPATNVQTRSQLIGQNFITISTL
jgi:uncharacterized C2H2 Zn-finger protein